VSKANKPANVYIGICLCLSVIGLIILPFLLTQAVNFEINFQSGNFIVGLLYCSICLLGMTAVFYPKKCQNTFAFKEESFAVTIYEKPLSGAQNRFEGHHPHCVKFDGNRVKVRGIALCSACTGLFIGAFLSLIVAVLYFFFGISFLIADLRICLLGEVAMLLGIAQFALRGFFKLVTNALFVFGAVLILVTANLISGNLLFDFYVLGLTVLLLLTRIMVSEWNNRRVCLACGDCRISY
jgi:hypothetical protein